MVKSSWRNTWHEDFDRVLYSMTKRERAALQRWGLLSVPGRRVFVTAAHRLDMDVAHTAYLIEQGALALNPTPVAICLTCGAGVESTKGLHLTTWSPGPFEAINFTDLHFCSEACLRSSTQEFAQTGSWPESPSLAPV